MASCTSSFSHSSLFIENPSYSALDFLIDNLSHIQRLFELSSPFYLLEGNRFPLNLFLNFPFLRIGGRREIARGR